MELGAIPSHSFIPRACDRDRSHRFSIIQAMSEVIPSNILFPTALVALSNLVYSHSQKYSEEMRFWTFDINCSFLQLPLCQIRNGSSSATGFRSASIS